MGRTVFRRTGCERRRRHITRTNRNRNTGAQAQCFRCGLCQSARNVCCRFHFGQHRDVEIQLIEQFERPTLLVGAAVEQPGQVCAIVTGDEIARAAMQQVILHIEKLVRARPHVGHALAQPDHLGRRVFAGKIRRAAGVTQPADEIEGRIARNGSAEFALGNVRRAHVEPDQGIGKSRAVLIDRYDARHLGGHAERFHAFGGGACFGQHAAGDRGHGRPPIFGTLLGPAGCGEKDAQRLAGACHDLAFGIEQRGLQRRCAEIIAKDEGSARHGCC